MPQILAERLRLCTDLRSVLDCTLDTCLTATGTSLANIQLMNWEQGDLEIAAQRGFDGEFLRFFARVRAHDGSACGRALLTRQVIVVDDVESDEAFSPASRSIILGAGVHAVQSIPLISRSGAFVGMLSTHFRTARFPVDDELTVMKALAQSAADAIILQRALAKDPFRTSLDLIASSKLLLRRISQEEEAWRMSPKVSVQPVR